MSIDFNTILSDKIEIFRSEENPNSVVGKVIWFENEIKNTKYCDTMTFALNKKFIEPIGYSNLEKTFINDIIEQCKYKDKWNKKDSIETIVNVINQLSNHIFVSNNISGANFIVCKENGYFINEIIHSSKFEFCDQEGNSNYPIGIISNTYYVYTTDYIDDDKLLIGYKSENNPAIAGGVYKEWIVEHCKNEKLKHQAFYTINDIDNYFRVLEMVDEYE